MNIRNLLLLASLGFAQSQFTCSTLKGSFKESGCCADAEKGADLPNFLLGSALTKTYDAPVLDPEIDAYVQSTTFDVPDPELKLKQIVHTYRVMMRRNPTLEEVKQYMHTSSLRLESDIFRSIQTLPDLTGKNVLVVGGSSGVVLTMSIMLAEANAQVFSFARTAAHFEIMKRTAMSDGTEIYNTPVRVSASEITAAERQYYESLEDFQQEMVWPQGAPALGAYFVKESPYDPLYNGILDVPESTFQNIHFYEADSRSPTQVGELIQKIRQEHGLQKIDYVIWGGASPGTGMSYHTTAQRKEQYESLKSRPELYNIPSESHVPHPWKVLPTEISEEERIRLSPNRSIAYGKYSGYWEMWESHVASVHTVMDKLFENFGYENVKANTTISEIGSIASFGYSLVDTAPVYANYNYVKATKAIIAYQYHKSGVKASVGTSGIMRGTGGFGPFATYFAGAWPSLKWQTPQAGVLGKNGGQHFMLNLNEIEQTFRFFDNILGGSTLSGVYHGYEYIKYMLEAESTGEFVHKYPLTHLEPVRKGPTEPWPNNGVPATLVGSQEKHWWEYPYEGTAADPSTFWASDDALKELNFANVIGRMLNNLRVAI